MQSLSPTRLAAQQARSAETENRLLAAAESLFAEKSFDDTSVAEIAERARVTTGAFYARFRDKEAVLQVLEERLQAAIHGGMDELHRLQQVRDCTTEEILHEYHRRLVHSTRAYQGVSRALVVRAQQDGTSDHQLQQVSATRMTVTVRAVLERGGFTHPGGNKAVEFIFLAVRSTVRATILFNQSWPGSKPLSDEALVLELTRMVMGYLGIEAGRK